MFIFLHVHFTMVLCILTDWLEKQMPHFNALGQFQDIKWEKPYSPGYGAIDVFIC